MPVIVTVVWLWSTGHEVNWWLGLLSVVTIIFVHAAGNVWSDIFDYRKGVDAKDTFGVRLLVDEVFTLQEFRRLSLSLNVVAVLLGLLVFYLTGPVTLYVGIAGIVLSFCYPKLKYMALGDVVILLCYGVLPTIGTSYIVTGEVVWRVLWLVASVGLITMAILHINNVRDIATDRRAGIHTVPMMTGVKAGVCIYVFEVLFPYVWLVAAVALGFVSVWALTAFLSLPLAVGNVRTLLAEWKGQWEKSLRLDEKTAQLHMVFCFLLIVGMVIARVV